MKFPRKRFLIKCAYVCIPQDLFKIMHTLFRVLLINIYHRRWGAYFAESVDLKGDTRQTNEGFHSYGVH